MANEIYVLDQDDKLLTVLPPDIIIEAPFREELNQIPDTPFSLTIDSNAEQAKYVVEENQVVFSDKEGDLRLYRIKEIDDIDNVNETQTTAICQPSFMELAKHTVVDKRMINDSAQVALDAALEGTRWTGIVDVNLGIATQNFYYIKSTDAIWKILEVWGGDFKDVVTFDGNQITSREIHIKQRLGSDTGKRFEVDHDIEQIQRTVLSYPVTALYGRGSSLETEGGGNSRYIDFANVEWKKSNGDPIDKPLGQKWVGDTDALQKYGLLHNGKLLHLDDIVQNQDIEDPKELLHWTWEQLQNKIENSQEVNYQLTVQLLESLAGYEHEKVSLGDTTRAIDRKFSRPIEIQARVIAMEYDLMDIEDTAVVEMGQFLELDDKRLDRVIEDINNSRSKWEHPSIDNGNFPDVKPDRPVNITVANAFETIQIYWDYANDVNVAHYEVFGSQVSDFIPDEQHLLWRGRVSAFGHKISTNQVWYYYIRAVNNHGTVSDFSEKVTGQTFRMNGETNIEPFTVTNELIAGGITADKLSVTELSAVSGNVGLLKTGILRSNNDVVEFNLNTGVLSILTNDDKKYIRMDGNGAYYARGALTIEREDGFKVINNGMLTGDFAVQGANPPFRDSLDVNAKGQWIEVSSSERRRFDRFTFSHMGRYLRLDLSRYVAQGGGAQGVIYAEDNGTGEEIWQIAFDNNEQHESATHLQSYNIDLGTPTGRVKSIIIRARTTVSGYPVSLHIGRVSIWG